MSCKNHPNVKAIANCELCEIPMCGLCAQFIEAGVFCERCVEIREAERFVANQTQQFEQQTSQPVVMQTEIENSESRPPKKSVIKWAQWLIIAVCFVTSYVGLLVYSNPGLFTMNSEARARQLAIDSLENCRMIFQEIGMLLEDMQMPDPALRCDESDTPNIISRTGDSIRVSHPNPEFHGFSAIFVTNSSHEPTFVE